MRNIYLKISFLSLMLIAIAGCGDFLDVNTDPNKTADASLNTLTPTILYYSAVNTYSAANVSNQYCQQIGGVAAGATDAQLRNTYAGLWSNIYLNVIPNANAMIKKAESTNSPHYSGIAKVVIAYNLGLGTAVWENIAYSTADNQLSNLSPAYDSQEDIYKSIQKLLDEAIVELSEPASISKPATDDIVFKGVIANWVKTAYTLKARYLLHTAKKTGAASYDAIADALSKGFKSNADDFQLVFTDKNFSPLYATALANNTGNVTTTFSATFMNMMNGTVQEIVDPRVSLISYKTSTTDPIYKGVAPGAGSGSNTVYNDKTNFYGWHFRLLAPLQMLTYAEAKFIEAEALYLKNGNVASAEAQAAYVEGIKANMSKIGVAAADITAFTSHVKVNPSVENLTISHIMVEKFKALFMNPEAWTDVRRYNYDANVFPGMALPANHNIDLNGNWIQRGAYPDSEVSRNSDVATQNFKNLDAKMWIFN